MLVLAGVTVILESVEPLLHAKAVPALAVSTELLPGQTLDGVAVMVALALFDTVMVWLAVAVQPPAKVTVTV